MLRVRREWYRAMWPVLGACGLCAGLGRVPARAAEGEAAPPAAEAPAPEAPKKPVNGPALLAKVANQLVVTNPVKSEALVMNGVASLTLPSGALQVLSRSPRAVVAKGVTKINTYLFGRVGGVIFENMAKGHADTQGQPAFAEDPLAELPPPDGTGLKPLGDLVAGGQEVVTLNPGIYGSWDLAGSAVVHLRPGRYVLKNGINQRDRASILGEGVLIINEAGPFESNGFGKLELTAPRQGPYTGLVFYQPKSNTQPMIVNSAANIAGTIYLPLAQFRKAGVTKATIGSIVADTALVDGANELIVEGVPFYVPPHKPASGSNKR